jgi:acetaldehyde dehydrogenase / alcohol dehydrogenase
MYKIFEQHSQRIYFGNESLDSLEEIKKECECKKCYLVTDENIKSLSQVFNPIIEKMESLNIDYEIFSSIESDPSYENVLTLVKDLNRYEPQLIIAIGGGSVIDAAKMGWLFYEYPSLSLNEVDGAGKVPKLGNKALFCAIPTTSGTGSESTAFAVITDRKVIPNIKKTVVSFNLVPTYAILEADLTLSLPPKLIAATGFDAFVHACEAYTSIADTTFADPIALEACSLIFSNLEKSFNNVDKYSKEKMLIASNMAGVAMNSGATGVCHGAAHQLGARLGLHHGLANAILYPYVIMYNKKAAGNKFLEVAKYSKLQNIETVNDFIKYISTLCKNLNLPVTIKDAGVSEKDFLKILDEMAECTIKDGATSFNPRKVTISDAKKLLKSAFYGEIINF